MTVAEIIREKLSQAFAPQELQIVDDSALHAGHAGARPEGETHFRVRIVSDRFRDMSRLDRQRAVNAVLMHEMQTRVHALSLAIFAPDEI